MISLDFFFIYAFESKIALTLALLNWVGHEWTNNKRCRKITKHFTYHNIIWISILEWETRNIYELKMILKLLFTRHLFQSRLMFGWFSYILRIAICTWKCTHDDHISLMSSICFIIGCFIVFDSVVFFSNYFFNFILDRSSLWWLWFWLIYTCHIQKLIIKCKVKSIRFVTIETDIYVQFLLLYICMFL